MRIAIVGSGISGMTCAHVLSKKYDVHLFESSERIGGHTHTHEVQTASGRYNIDTGFIVFNDRNYPNFIKLMDKIGIESQPSSMSFSVKVQSNGLEYNGTSINSLFCQRSNLLKPSFYRMIKDIIRFNKEATRFYLDHPTDPTNGLTLEKYLRDNHYSEQFVEHYVMPMGAAIWSAGREEMKHFPFHFFVRFFHHHGMLTVDDRPLWKVLKGGSKSYIPALTAPFVHNIHLNSEVVEVWRKDGKILLLANEQSELKKFEFDHVVFASHADQTKRIIKDPTVYESQVLEAFSYRPNDVILHTDSSVLPNKKLGHASWNYYLPKIQTSRVAVTYHMNILQNINSPESFLVSLNMDELIDPKKIIKKISYSHPVYTYETVKAQDKWDSISGKNNTHFCGAYWGNGFHEDGVKSGLKVCSAFREEL
jgi:uncharacterized protein